MCAEVVLMHLPEIRIFISARQAFVIPDLVEILPKPQFRNKILRRPITRQASHYGTVRCQNKRLQIMRTGAIGCTHRIACRHVDARHTGIGRACNVFIANDEIVFEVRESWFLRERHGSQAVTGTSRGAGHAAQHVDPEDHFALLTGALLDLAERLIPVKFGRHGGDAIVRGLTTEICRLPRLSRHEQRH